MLQLMLAWKQRFQGNNLLGGICDVVQAGEPPHGGGLQVWPPPHQGRTPRYQVSTLFLTTRGESKKPTHRTYGLVPIFNSGVFMCWLWYTSILDILGNLKSFRLKTSKMTLWQLLLCLRLPSFMGFRLAGGQAMLYVLNHVTYRV